MTCERCGCAPQSVAGCQCATADTDSVNVNGAGTTGAPFSWDVRIDPVTGNLIELTAAGLRTLLPRVNEDPPHATAYMSTQEFHTSTGNVEAVTYNAATDDNDSIFDIGVPGLLINTAGWYLIETTVIFPAVGNANDFFFAEIDVGGVRYRVASTRGNTGLGIAVGGSRMLRLAGGSQLRTNAFQDSGGNLPYGFGVNNTHLTATYFGKY